MTPTSAERGLGGGRNHVCLVHDSVVERMRVLEAELTDAFARGQRVVMLADPDDHQRLSDVIGRTGRGDRDGQLEVRRTADAYLADGLFDPDAMLGVLDDEKRRSLGDGFTGVHLLADMTWAADDPHALERLPAYEHAAGHVFADGRATATCQYDRHRFAPDALTACAAAHELLLSAFDESRTLRDGRATLDIGSDGMVRVRGEIDLDNADLLARALADAAERAHGRGVTVDTSQLTFIDVRGARALFDAARTSELTLLAPHRSLRVMLHAFAVARQLPAVHAA